MGGILQVVSAAQCVSCSNQEQINTLRFLAATRCTHLVDIY